MLGPLPFVYRGVIVNKFVLQEIFFCNSKKNYKKAFFTKKNLFTEHKFENVVKQRKMHKGHITGHRKNFNKKKSKLKNEGVAFISKKYLKSHFRDPKKRFFSISYFEHAYKICFLEILKIESTVSKKPLKTGKYRKSV